MRPLPDVYKRQDLAYVKDLKEVRRGRIKEYAETHEGVTYVADCTKVWTVPCDIALPCATQNEINKESAEALVKNGCTVVCEEMCIRDSDHPAHGRRQGRL